MMNRAVPGWARPNPNVDPTTTILEAQTGKLREDAARERLHVAGVGHLPVDHELAREELTEEQRALRSSRPRTRRWKTLEKLDNEVGERQQQHADAIARLQDAELRLQAAPDDDARLLADWLEAGEKGTRPDLTLDVYTHSMAPDEIAPETFLRLLTGRR